MKRFSALSLVGGALSGQRGWERQWRDAQPRAEYDVLVIGGGGHGLATAYYLAKEHGIRNVAVLEKGWIGGGNSGRNTQVARSNYFYPTSSAFYDHSLRLYENLHRELNFNVMFSQRGLIQLVHSEHEVQLMRRAMNAMRMNGVDAEMLSAEEVARRVPILNLHSRYPVLGGLVQGRAGIVRHDAVVWGFARGASAP